MNITINDVKDILVIILAGITIIAMIFIVFLSLQLMRLATDIKAELDPIVRSLTGTAETVQRTTEFTTEMVVKPTAKAAATAVGVARFVAALRGGRKRK